MIPLKKPMEHLLFSIHHRDATHATLALMKLPNLTLMGLLAMGLCLPACRTTSNQSRAPYPPSSAKNAPPAGSFTDRVSITDREAPKAGLRVGTFDSRAIAIAWVNSKPFNARLAEKQSAFETAKNAGEEARAEKVQGEMRRLQEEIHKQGFSIWPVHNILAHFKKDLPTVATEANVDILVCKWDVMYGHRNEELVDVTHLLVKLFDPNEKALKTIEQIQNKDPVPLEELKGHDHL